MQQLLKPLQVLVLINIILIGSNSMIAQSLSSTQYSDAFNFVRVSRKSNPTSTPLNHIFHDFSHPFSCHVHDHLVSQIRSLINPVVPTVLCLFAWSGTPRTSINPMLSDTIKTENNNILRNLSFLLSDLDLSQVIFLSSAGGIYRNHKICVHNESSIPSPITPYGVQKLEAETALASITEEINIPLCILRISCAYGVNPVTPDQGVLNKWIFDGLINGQINIYNSLDSELNFISFAQVTAAVKLAISCKLEGVYNIGSDRSTSLSTIYSAVNNSIYGLKSQFLCFEDRHLFIDSNKFKFATGCKFKAQIENDFDEIFKSIQLIIKERLG